MFTLIYLVDIECVASAKLLQNLSISPVDKFSAIFSIIADPTTTPSATLATSLAVSGVFTPNPTQIGNDVFFLSRLICD